MSDDGIKSVDKRDFEFFTHVASFDLIEKGEDENYILSLSENRPHQRTPHAYTCPPRLLEELARHILRTVAPTTEERILDSLNRIEQLLEKRER